MSRVVKVEEIVEVLAELKEDNTVPKNVKAKIKVVMDVLKEDEDLKLKVNKVYKSAGNLWSGNVLKIP